MDIKNRSKLLNKLGVKVFIYLLAGAMIPLIAYMISHTISMGNNFSAIGQQEAEHTTELAKSVLYTKAEELQKTAKDYGIWDDTYNKIQQKDIPWFKETFSEWIPNNFGVDLLIVANRENEIMDGFNHRGEGVLELLEDSRVKEILMDKYDKKRDPYYRGLKMYNGELYLVGMSPILKNSYEGPVQGIVIIGARVTPKVLEDMRNKFGYNIFISYGDHIISTPSAYEKARYYLNEFIKDKDSSVMVVSDSIMVGRVPIEDVSNNRIGCIYTINAQDFFVAFAESIFKNTWITLFFTTILTILLSQFLRNKIIGPIKILERQIIKMGEESTIDYIDVKGSDEIVNLAHAFNRMIDNLEFEKRENKNLKTLSITDGLTSLYNHRYFYEFAEKKISEDVKELTILFCDIDKFKKINDSQGHVTGDMILKEVAGIIREVVEDQGTVFRYGGEEFVIILENKTNKDAYKIAEAIRLRINRAHILSKYAKNIPVTVSIGLAAYPKDGIKIEDVVEKADHALYYAKKKGRNQCCIYSDDVDKQLGRDSAEYVKQEMLLHSVQALTAAIDAKDFYTGKHSDSVTKYGLILAEKLNLSQEDKYALRIGGLLHDCGKIGIPDDIIHKPDRLTNEEWQIIKNHTILGNNIVKNIIENQQIASCVRNHHERWDGKGYPDGLSGTDIPLYARIICIADAYHAMISDRPYRRALSKETALKELWDNEGTQFDPKLVKMFIEAMEAYEMDNK